MFLSSSSDSKKDKKAPEIPCIGISFGIDRIFSLIYPTWVTQRAMRSNNVMVYVMSAGGDGHLSDRVALVSELRAGGINADYLGKTKPKLPQQFAAGERVEAPFAVIVGGDELKEGLVTVKEQRWELVGVEGQVEKKKIDNEDKGVKVRRSELVRWLKETQVWKEWEGGKF
jgi:histidyl-tRNA synthetase